MPTYLTVGALPSAPITPAWNYVTVGSQSYAWGALISAWVAVTVSGGVTEVEPPTPETFLQMKTQKFSYDFATQGGAVSNITLTGGTIPSGAMVVGLAIQPPTAFTSAGAAQVALTLETAGDLQAAALYSNVTGTNPCAAPIHAGGLGALTLVTGSGGYGINEPIVTTAARSVVLAVTVAALTAGKFDIYITYMNPES